MADTIKEILQHFGNFAYEVGKAIQRGDTTPPSVDSVHIEQSVALAEIKRIVSEAKPARKTMDAAIKTGSDAGWGVTYGYNEAIDEYHTNLMKALGEGNG